MPQPLKTYTRRKATHHQDDNLTISVSVNHRNNASNLAFTYKTEGNIAGILAELYSILEYTSLVNTVTAKQPVYSQHLFKILNPSKYIFTKYAGIRNTAKSKTPKSKLIDEGLSLLLREDIPLTKPASELVNSVGIDHLFNRLTERGKRKYLALPKEVRRYWTASERIGKKDQDATG